LQKLARPIGRDQQLSLDLWRTGIMEARIIAAFIGEPAKVTSAQMESWLKDFDSWAVCDCCCCYLFDKTKDAYKKAIAWSRRKAEYEKRAAFALMAYLAVHDKPAPDDAFLKFLPIIAREAWDDRNFVKKAVNWALRQIGKRNRALNQAAIQTGAKFESRARARPAGSPPAHCGNWKAKQSTAGSHLALFSRINPRNISKTHPGYVYLFKFMP
jgi:3-methyladenine DNA glycosylase AlkD